MHDWRHVLCLLDRSPELTNRHGIELSTQLTMMQVSKPFPQSIDVFRQIVKLRLELIVNQVMGQQFCVWNVAIKLCDKVLRIAYQSDLVVLSAPILSTYSFNYGETSVLQPTAYPCIDPCLARLC